MNMEPEKYLDSDVEDDGEPEFIAKRLFDSTQFINRIDRPFEGWSRGQIDAVAQKVARHYGLRNLEDVFVRAASVLRDPDPSTWQHIDGITKAELTVLYAEQSATYWDQPWTLHSTYIMLFLCAITHGWAQTGMNGANLSWPHQLGLVHGDAAKGSCSPPNGNLAWIFAAVNATPYLAAGLGCWFSDPLNEVFFGRRPAIFASALLIFGASIGSAFTTSWPALIACRAALGIGSGCKAAVAPVFMAEIAPSRMRGSLMVNWKVFNAIGICLGFASNMIAAQTGLNAWRWQLASLCVPAFVLIWGVLFIRWDSPRFLMKNENRSRAAYVKMKQRKRQRLGSSETSQSRIWRRRLATYCPFRALRNVYAPNASLPYRSPAYDAWLVLRRDPFLAVKELLLTQCQMCVEMQADSPSSSSNESADLSLKSSLSWFRRLSRLWKKDYLFREARAAVFLMVAQQLTNVLMFYSSTIFCSAGSGTGSSTSMGPLVLSFGLGFINMVFALLAYKWIETHGRRWLVLFTTPALPVILAAAAGVFAAPSQHTQKIGVTTLGFLYAAFFAPGLGAVSFTYSAEVFPTELRMVGMSLAVSMNFLSAGLLAFFVPKLTLALGNASLLGLFSGLNMVALVLIWRYVPEIVGPPNSLLRAGREPMTLEELFYVFRPSMHYHRKYQWVVYLPYVWKCVKSTLTGKEKPDSPEPYFIWARKEQPRVHDVHP